VSDDPSQAEQAVNELRQAGFSNDHWQTENARVRQERGAKGTARVRVAASSPAVAQDGDAMHSEPRHDYGGTMSEEASKQGLPETMGRHLLLLASAAQFALFVPLAWWARKHPHPPVELGVTHLVQQKHATWLRSTITAFSTITGSAVLLNLLVIRRLPSCGGGVCA